MKRSQRGFTLMELMVVIVIVAILAAVAVPLYVNYVKDAQRTEAKGAIGAIISAEQVHFQKYGTYLSGLTDAAAIEAGLGVDLTESKVNWDFEINTTTDLVGFQVVATGKATKPGGGAGPAKDLEVTYNHSRTNGPEWLDEAPETP